MSSLRNAVQRRNHKERAQPLERSKWGLLEKHKDYSLRAKDHNAKKARLRTLRQKAAERNPDEFAFGMMSSATQKGVRVAKRGLENGGSGVLAPDVVQLLKTQDAGYLTTVLQQTRREADKVREQVALLETGVDNRSTKHELDDVGRRKRFDEDGNEVALLPGPSTTAEDKVAPRDRHEEKVRKQRRKTIQSLHRRVDALDNKGMELSRVLEAVEVQRAKMKGTIGGVNKDGAKFKIRERKR